MYEDQNMMMVSEHVTRNQRTEADRDLQKNRGFFKGRGGWVITWPLFLFLAANFPPPPRFPQPKISPRFLPARPVNFRNVPLEHTPDPKNHLFMKEIRSYLYFGVPGVCSMGLLEFS